MICHAGFMLSAIPSDKRIEIRSTIELLFTIKSEIATSSFILWGYVLLTTAEHAERRFLIAPTSSCFSKYTFSIVEVAHLIIKRECAKPEISGSVVVSCSDLRIS